MRFNRSVSILAAAASTAAIIAPNAGAHAIIAGTGGGPVVVSAHAPAASGTDWGLIGGGTAGMVIVLGAGVTVALRRGHAPARRVRTAA